MRLTTTFNVKGYAFVLELEQDDMATKEAIAKKVNAAAIAATTAANCMLEDERFDRLKTPSPTIESPATHEQESHEQSGDGGSMLVNKVVVEGTIDNPIVKMFSPNEKLKFPVMTCPYSVLSRVIEASYPGIDREKHGKFGQCGTVHAVNWTVFWVPSPKNPRYKDLSKVQVNT